MAGKSVTQRIQLVGGDEIKLQLQGIGKAGELAFTRVQAAAKGVNLSGVGAGAVDAAQRMKDLRDRVGDLKDSFDKFKDTLPRLTQAVGRFAQRITIASAGAVAAGVGLANTARNVAKEVLGESNALEKQTQAQIDANNAALQGEIAQINLESSLRKLTVELATGKITYQQYAEQVRKLKTDQLEQQRVSNEVAAATARVKDENERLQKSLKDRQAYQKLADTFGGPLLSSLVQFGTQVEQIRQQIVAKFGPAVARLVDLLSSTIARNAGAISTFFDQASAKIDELVTKHGPELQKFFETVGSAAAKVFLGLLDAAPTVIDFFNNKIAPAVSKVIGVVQAVADAFNAVFGTKITAGSLVLLTIFAQMTGSIRLLFVVTRTLGAAWGALGGTIAAAGGVLNTLFGGNAVTGGIIRLGVAVGTSGGFFKTLFTVVRLGIPVFSALASGLAALLGIGFAPALAIVGALSAALFVLATKVNWGAFLSAAGTAILGVLDFFKQLLQGAINIGAALISGLGAAWDAVKSAANTAWSAIVGIIVGFATRVVDGWNFILKFFTDLWATVSKLAGDAWAAITQGATDLFNFILSSAAAPFEAIKAAAQSMYDAVFGWFGKLIEKAKQLLGLQAQAAAGSGSGGGTPAGHARGGLIRGPGTGTSDSILARLSNGEFVVKAEAVRNYGTDFLRRLNSLQLPKFADGGLVRVAQSFLPEFPAPPRFAAGGIVATGGGRPMTLQIGDQVIPGLTADATAVRQLQRYAAAKSVHSAGRKPLWFKG